VLPSTFNMCYLAHSKCASSTKCAKNEFHSCCN